MHRTNVVVNHTQIVKKKWEFQSIMGVILPFYLSWTKRGHGSYWRWLSQRGKLNCRNQSSHCQRVAAFASWPESYRMRECSLSAAKEIKKVGSNADEHSRICREVEDHFLRVTQLSQLRRWSWGCEACCFCPTPESWMTARSAPDQRTDEWLQSQDRSQPWHRWEVWSSFVDRILHCDHRWRICVRSER